ncbi:MAG: RNase adapter RapZ [Gammaproteobacteria bacterium]|nr:RNase adapter RapZ [Gammaproteobacteria bacterium]
MKLIIVSGLSGSGKTVALHTLEDENYFCIDNLPLALLPAYIDELQHKALIRRDKVAVGIDARAYSDDFSKFGEYLQQIRQRGIDIEILFLTASDVVLLKRFSETRRKHPLSENNMPLADAIRHERELLSNIQEHADLMIDTTRKNVHELRSLVIDRVRAQADDVQPLSILLQSFGFKHGVPNDTDFVFDARCLPNPHWLPELRPLTGKDAAVIKFLEQEPMVNTLLEDVHHFLEAWLPRFMNENRRYLTISIGCTGGQHRSVYLVEQLAMILRRKMGNIAIRHRELSS